MPVYNGEKYLTEALNSILCQTCGDFELFICDNASTDGTEEICRDYAGRDRRIRFARNEVNLGASRNYRRVFELSRGRFFRWANHDDLMAPDLLERCRVVLEGEPSVVLAYGRTQLIDEAGREIRACNDDLHINSGSPSERYIDADSRITMCNVIYGLMRRDALEQTQLIGDYIGADCCFVPELALYGRFREIPETLFFRRIHADAYSSQQDLRKIEQFYNPHVRIKASFPTWRQYWERLRTVERAPIPAAEKMRLRSYVLRSVVVDRGKLWRDVKRYWRGQATLTRATPMGLGAAKP